MWTVYIHICPNKKVYIGITSQAVSKRWNNGKGYKNNPYFTNAILKYGWDNIEHRILFEDLEEKDAKEIEIKLIEIWKSQKMCYNMTDGGDGYLGLVHTDEFNKNLSERSKNNTWGSMKTKPVVQLNKDTLEPIQEFESAREAMRQTGISYKLISRAIRKNMCTGGFRWKYKFEDGKYVRRENTHTKVDINEK